MAAWLIFTMEASTFTPPNGLQKQLLHGPMQPGLVAIWIGTGGGLSRLKQGRLVAIPASGIKDLSIFAIGEDDQGIIATTTVSTYLRVQDDKLVADNATAPIQEAAEAPKPRPFVFTMCRDSSGRLWYGTNEGLFYSRPGAASIMAPVPSVSYAVTSIYDDGRGYLWITGRTPGVARLRVDDGQLFEYTATEGLADDEITRALCDKEGNLWASTPNGIFRVGRQDLDDVALGVATQVQ